MGSTSPRVAVATESRDIIVLGPRNSSIDGFWLSGPSAGTEYVKRTDWFVPAILRHLTGAVTFCGQLLGLTKIVAGVIRPGIGRHLI